MPRPRKDKGDNLNYKLLDSLKSGDKIKNKYGFFKNDNSLIINDDKYIVNSFNDMIVIGRLNKRNEINSLDEKDIEWCKKNNFSYEKYL